MIISRNILLQNLFWTFSIFLDLFPRSQTHYFAYKEQSFSNVSNLYDDHRHHHGRQNVIKVKIYYKGGLW